MPASTEKQRRFFGAVMGAKKGKPGSSGKAKEVAHEMSEDKIKHYLKTGEAEYYAGFVAKCAALGVDPEVLAKQAQGLGGLLGLAARSGLNRFTRGAGTLAGGIRGMSGKDVMSGLRGINPIKPSMYQAAHTGGRSAMSATNSPGQKVLRYLKTMLLPVAETAGATALPAAGVGVAAAGKKFFGSRE